MSRIFLDVGAHRGDTVEILLQARLKVDRVVAFDPSPICQGILDFKFGNDPRVTVVKAGLWSSTCEMDLHNEGNLGGTIHEDYRTCCHTDLRTTRCQFISASDWFRDNISPADETFIKLNCEGSECEIVNALLDSAEYCKVTATLIDFDVRKSPSQNRQEPELLARLAGLGIGNVHAYTGCGIHAELSSLLG